MPVFVPVFAGSAGKFLIDLMGCVFGVPGEYHK